MRKITVREKQVIELLSEGLTAKEIAYNLELSIHTIRAYVKSIISKLGARNIAHAVALVQKNKSSDIEIINPKTD